MELILWGIIFVQNYIYETGVNISAKKQNRGRGLSEKAGNRYGMAEHGSYLIGGPAFAARHAALP